MKITPDDFVAMDIVEPGTRFNAYFDTKTNQVNKHMDDVNALMGEDPDVVAREIQSAVSGLRELRGELGAEMERNIAANQVIADDGELSNDFLKANPHVHNGSPDQAFVKLRKLDGNIEDFLYEVQEQFPNLQINPISSVGVQHFEW